MAEFDDVLAVSWDAVVPAVAGATGVARGHLGEGWLIGNAINGGVLMALATSTASEVLGRVGHGDPLTWSAHFLSAAVPGPVDAHVEVLRVGRGMSTASVRVVQPGEDGPIERVRVTRTFGTLNSADPVHRAPDPPSMPDPATIGFAVGQPSRRGVIRAWVRMRHGRRPDAALLPYAVDALMPVSFDLGAGVGTDDRAHRAGRRGPAARQLVCSGAHRQPDRRRRGAARRAARHPRAG